MIDTNRTELRRRGSRAGVVLGGSLAALTGMALLGAPAVAQAPRTGAEAVGFQRTTSHAEVLEFLQEVRSLTDRMLVVPLTTTNLGRSLPMVVLGDRPSATPGTAWFSEKPTVLFTGSVHGNERAGKEGSLQLIRELALGELQPLLDRVNVLIIPSLNPDGAEAPSRTNSLGYDMNRDFIVAETPEISALLEVLTSWWPDIYVDVHNGGAYPYNMTYQATLHPAADQDLVAFARGPLFRGVQDHLGLSDMITYWYSGPRQDASTGEWAWTTTPPWARKQHTYGGLQNIVTLLFEIPGSWTLEEQADNARESMEGLIRYAADNPEELRRAVTGARERTITTPPTEIPIEVVEAAYPEPEQFYVMPRGGGRGGRGGGGARPEPELVTGENRTLFVPTETRPWPWAYAIDGRLDEVVDHLRRHGIEVEQLLAPATISAERYRITELTWDTSPYQNHLLAHADVATEATEVELPAGTYLVRTAQNGGRLLTQVLEPDTEDSLLSWNFLDHTLPSPQRVAGAEDGVPYDLIYRVVAPASGVRSVIVR